MKTDFQGIQRWLYDAIEGLYSAVKIKADGMAQQDKLLGILEMIPLKEHEDFFYKKSKLQESQPLELTPLELLTLATFGLDANSLTPLTENMYPKPLAYVLKHLTFDASKLLDIKSTLAGAKEKLSSPQFLALQEESDDSNKKMLADLASDLNTLCGDKKKEMAQDKAASTTKTEEKKPESASPEEPILTAFHLTNDEAKGIQAQAPKSLVSKLLSESFMPNLSDYILCFTAFDPEYDVTKAVNPLEKAKNTYLKTKAFIEKLKAFPDLQLIANTLKDINEYFAGILAIKTNNVIKLDNAIDKDNVGRHLLAKRTLKDLGQFIKTLEQAIKDLEAIERQFKTPTLDPDAKLDAVEHQLLEGASIAVPFQAMRGPNGIDINVRTSRPVTALLLNGDLQAQKTPSFEREREIIKIFNDFIFNANENNFKIGFVALTESQQSIPKVAQTSASTSLSMR